MNDNGDRIQQDLNDEEECCVIVLISETHIESVHVHEVIIFGIPDLMFTPMRLGSYSTIYAI